MGGVYQPSRGDLCQLSNFSTHPKSENRIGQVTPWRRSLPARRALCVERKIVGNICRGERSWIRPLPANGFLPCERYVLEVVSLTLDSPGIAWGVT